MWSGFQSILQCSNFYPKSVSRDVYHRPQRAPAQANGRRRTCEALIADYAGFGGSSILHYDDQRNQTPVREIRKFQLSTRLVKDEVVRQIDVFQMRTKRVVFSIGDRQKYGIADGLSRGIRALAGLYDLQMFADPH